ncbi:MAG: cell division protein FtsH, partial [Desulfopila sp.]
ILEIYCNNTKMATQVDLEVVARGTPGFTGADLENLVNEAALMAARSGAKEINLELLEKAKDKILMGAERRSMIITEKEKEVTAYHEAGHALIAKLLPDTDPIHKVTIIPRGRALGLTMQLPIDEKYTHSKKYLESTLCILFGGRVAEDIVFSEITTGAGNDLERATTLARKMVCEWGMSDELGPLTYGKKEEQIFLGREISQHRDFSEDTARQIDGAVKRIVVEARDKVYELLEDNRAILKMMAEELLERETIVLDDIERIMEESDPEKYPRDAIKRPQSDVKKDTKNGKADAEKHTGESSGAVNNDADNDADSESDIDPEVKDRVDLSAEEDSKADDNPSPPREDGSNTHSDT